METYTSFTHEQPKTPGFFILRYQKWNKETYDQEVFLSGSNHHHMNVYSYFATYYNHRDGKTCHDMGQYIWVNSYEIYSPKEWRKMTKEEATKFSCLLYSFGRKKFYSFEENNSANY